MSHFGRSGYSERSQALICCGLHVSSSLSLHQLPQFGIKDQGAHSLAPGVVASAGMGEVGVVDTFVVRLEVTTQLP